MIFATVGTQLPFDRMLLAVDSWASAHPEMEVIAQTGQAKRAYANMVCHETLGQDAFRQTFEAADVVVSHAGMGTILTASELGKPVVIMARLAQYNEHRTDHQLATAAEMSRLGNVFVAESPADLGLQIDAALSVSGQMRRTLGADASPELLQALRGVIRDTATARGGLDLSGLPEVGSEVGSAVGSDLGPEAKA